ncbi:Mfs transporter [Aspergillus sclerotialis]|uniref:Mfs transporter n=1 Tax=Aspergillus sclerotialis TaxID=2070753 RepID=A0A3A2ZV32_9EURO|nr:Mfs transporter [Aspergillus sclerotialis]
MGLGVLEDTKLAHVPGSAYVLDKEPCGDQVPVNSSLKYDRSGPVPIALVPQPSDDPNDPLNWPLWKRDLILAALSFVAVLCSTASSIMAANTVTISLYYERSFTSVALLTGYHLCGVGVAGVLIVPTARVWGKRHLFLLGNILMIASSAWAGASGHNYQSLLWARIFQGVALAPFEALVNACVGDLFFLHERGKRMALSNVALFGAAFLTPVVVGKVTHTLGWQWTFYLLAIFTGASLPLMVFFVPETAFRRANYLNTDYENDTNRAVGNGMESHLSFNYVPEGSQVEEAKGPSIADKDANGDASKANLPSGIPKKNSYLMSLMPFNGRKTDENFFKLLLRPFPLFFHPGILFVSSGLLESAHAVHCV